VLQWALKLNSALAAAETWHLECHKLNVKKCILLAAIPIQDEKF